MNFHSNCKFNFAFKVVLNFEVFKDVKKGGELGFVTKIKNAQNYGRKSTILYVNKDDSIVAVAFVRLPFYAQSQ